jgi:hypothetical protein
MKRYATALLTIGLVAATLGLALLASSCASATGVYTSAALDLATTRAALNNGAVEANPIMRNQAVAIAIDAATAYLVVRISEHMKSKLPLRIYSAIHFGAAGWNAVQIARTKR